MADDKTNEALQGQVAKLEEQVANLLKQLENGGNPADITTALELQSQIDEFAAKSAELATALETAQKQAEEAKKAHEAELAALKADASMSDDEKEHCKGMSSDAKSNFLAMSAADRKKAMSKAAEGDETLIVGTRTIRKSAVGDDQFEVMKMQQEEILKHREEIAKERDARELAELCKRADAEYLHVPGSTDERALMLREIGKMDEPVQKLFTAVFTQSEALAKGAFTPNGTKGGKDADDPTIAKKANDFRAKCEDIRKAEKCSRTDAQAKARIQYPELFKAYQEQGAN